MSLVPILYTSLILFTVLMVVIITISYISYKVRNRNSGEEEEKQVSTRYIRQQPAVISERRNIQPQAIRVVPAIKNPELKRTYRNERPIERSTVINQRPAEKYTSSNTTRYEEPREISNDNYGRRTNSGSFRSRLEIINRIAPEESTREKFTVSGSGSIALPKYYENFRAIQYYSDEDEEYLYKPSRHYS